MLCPACSHHCPFRKPSSVSLGIVISSIAFPSTHCIDTATCSCGYPGTSWTKHLLQDIPLAPPRRPGEHERRSLAMRPSGPRRHGRPSQTSHGPLYATTPRGVAGRRADWCVPPISARKCVGRATQSVLPVAVLQMAVPSPSRVVRPVGPVRRGGVEGLTARRVLYT